MTKNNTCYKVHRLMPISFVCAASLIFSVVAQGAVSVTASRDYVDRKFASATNAVYNLSTNLSARISGLENEKQDVIEGAQLDALNSGITSSKVASYVTKSELTELVTIIVTNLMGNVYWNSSDGGQTIDAYWRDGTEVSNIVNQVNAYLQLENWHIDSSNVPAMEDDGSDGNGSNESEE